MAGPVNPLDEIPEAPSISKAWMVIFTDLVSLMLTFFVLLFSMSNVQVDRWKQMVDALSTTLNPSTEKEPTPISSQYNIATIFRKRAVNLDYLSSVVDEAMAKDQVLKSGILMRLDDRTVIALPGDLMFTPGKAVLTEGGRQAMFVLGGVLRNVGNQIAVNGYTAPAPPVGKTYKSNWELSMARAAAVANSLRKVGYTDDIIAFGYAASRFKELPKLPEAQRMSLARRVDVVIYPTVGD